MEHALLAAYDSASSSDENDGHFSPPSTSQQHQKNSLNSNQPSTNHSTAPPSLTQPQHTLSSPSQPQRSLPSSSQPQHSLIPPPPTLPSDLARELRRTGCTVSQVDIVDIDARITQHHAPSTLATPATSLAVNARAGRIAKKANVSRLERRKHQITALAAEVQAVEMARRTMGDATARGRLQHK